jgi:hypothetical protein
MTKRAMKRRRIGDDVDIRERLRRVIELLQPLARAKTPIAPRQAHLDGSLASIELQGALVFIGLKAARR